MDIFRLLCLMLFSSFLRQCCISLDTFLAKRCQWDQLHQVRCWSGERSFSPFHLSFFDFTTCVKVTLRLTAFDLDTTCFLLHTERCPLGERVFMKKYSLLGTQFFKGVGIHVFEVRDTKTGEIKPYRMVRFTHNSEVFHEFFASKNSLLRKIEIALKLARLS